MSRKREALCMGIGILASIVLSGPAAQAATEDLTTTRSTQPIYSDGVQVSITNLCSEAAFGDLPWRRVNNPSWADVRPGDLIRYDNATGGHVVVVLEKTDEYVKVNESGTNNKARWGGQYFRW